MKKILILIIVGILGYNVYMYINKEKEITLKEFWDSSVQAEYEDMYSDNYEKDLQAFIEKAEQEKLEKIEKAKKDIPASYWKIIKDRRAKEAQIIIETYPEVSILPEVEKLDTIAFTAQNDYFDLDSYLRAKHGSSPMIGLDVIKICKESNISAWQCRLGLAIIMHESKYGTAYAGGRPDLGNVEYHNYAGVKCDSKLAKIKPCKFPDENGMYITKFNSPESFLRYFFEQIIGKNWGACKTTACMSPKYVAPMGERNLNWENKINGEILNLHFIEY